MSTGVKTLEREMQTTTDVRPSGLDSADVSSIDAAPSHRIKRNAQALEREMSWFSQVLETRLALYFKNECDYSSICEIPPPQQDAHDSDYGEVINRFNMCVEVRLILMLSLIPQLKPQLLNLFLIKDSSIERAFVEFGGWKGDTHAGFLPTGETAAFLLAGNDLEKRIHVMSLLDTEHYLQKEGILRNSFSGNAQSKAESFLTMPLALSSEFFYRLTTGHCEKPDFSIEFPAKRIETDLDWEDLVLPEKVLDEIGYINTWLENKDFILHGMGLNKSIKPGYRALFYGPPGTGKTLTASLLGKANDLDVYRVDLSSVVSKYIGETEKNLERVFQQAETREWILFFDEADALFGKRTQAQSSNDRHANQEVSYLLQRIETFPGVVILASNIKENIDDAFARRLQSMTYFAMPDVQDREILWQKALGSQVSVDSTVNLKDLAKKFELAGGAVVNVVRFAAITALKSNRRKISQDDLLLGIDRELRKLGKAR